MSKPTKSDYFIKPPSKWRDIDSVPNCDAPLRHVVAVSWGDCDPAQIAYTANIPKWALAAVEAWYRSCLGVGWFEINLDHGVGTPFASINLDFHAPVTPRADMEITVLVSKLGNCSLTHALEARQGDVLCWSGSTTAVFVQTANLQPLQIPENMRLAIRRYIDAQGDSRVDAQG
ncbi:MAG: thioesterase family protein [Pseudomonadota bacterium]